MVLDVIFREQLHAAEIISVSVSTVFETTHEQINFLLI